MFGCCGRRLGNLHTVLAADPAYSRKHDKGVEQVRLFHGMGAFVVVTLMTITLADQVRAATYYASPSGTGAGTQGAPCSLPDCIDKAALPGDKCVLLDGTYSVGKMATKHSGSSGSPITIEAQNSRKAIVRGDVDDLCHILHDWIVVRGIVFDGLESGGSGDGLVHLAIDVGNIVFENNVVRNSGGVGIKVKQGVHDVIIRNNTIQNTGNLKFYGEGIYVGNANYAVDQQPTEHIEIYGNDISDNTENIIDCKRNTRFVSIHDNVLHGQVNGSTKGVVDQQGDPATAEGTISLNGHNNKVFNNIMFNNVGGIAVSHICPDGGHEFFNNVVFDFVGTLSNAMSNDCYGSGDPAGFGSSKIYNNTFYNLPTHQVKGAGLTIKNNIGLDGVAGNLETSAFAAGYFVNASGSGTNADFHLTASATAAIDKATSAPFSATDIDGKAPFGAGRDYGAYEYEAPSAYSIRGHCLRGDVGGAGGHGWTTLEIVNLRGRLVCSTSAPPHAPEVRRLLSRLPRGVYVARMRAGGAIIWQNKMSLANSTVQQ